MNLDEKQKLATETYELGITMAETFKGDEKLFMILAIMACISGIVNKPYSLMPITNVGGDVFKSMRIEKGYTLRQVEDATGISNSYLSQLETGKVNNPSQDIVNKILNWYNNGIAVSKCCGRFIDGLDECISN